MALDDPGSRPAGDTPMPQNPTESLGPPSGEPLSGILGLDATAPAHDPLLGSEIGGVRIVRLIAQGGMGRVYEGRQERPSRTVAVKVMRPGLATPSMMKRFEYEAEILARLRHPGIAQIFSAGVHQLDGVPVPFFVMEYIPDARTLTRYADDLKLPTRARLDLFRSVCDAVAHGHQRGVIHRDLKPSNILVDASGHPKVIDFGVAKATDSDLTLTTMRTDLGQLVGTLQYMGPEQLAGDPNAIDARCDVYALGVVLYELLTGRLPYDVRQKAVLEVMRIVREEDPTPIWSVNRTVRRDVAVITEKCLEKDRARRYPTAGELAADVARHQAGEPIAASPPGFLDRVVRMSRRHRAVAVATAAAFTALAVAGVGIGISSRWADKKAERSQQELDLLRSRVADAQSAVEASRADYDAGTVTFDWVIDTVNKLAEAELALATTDADRIAVAERRLGLLIWFERRITALTEAQARGGEAEKLAMIRRERKSAEIALLQARGPQPVGKEQRARDVVAVKRALLECKEAWVIKRYAEKSLEVAEAQVRKAEQANERSPGAVSKAELEELRAEAAQARTRVELSEIRAQALMLESLLAGTEDPPAPRTAEAIRKDLDTATARHDTLKARRGADSASPGLFTEHEASELELLPLEIEVLQLELENAESKPRHSSEERAPQTPEGGSP